jgi:abequosyltransferase
MTILSVCIPSFNRPNELGRLLDSILGQSENLDIEVLIAEDQSPRRLEIEGVVLDKIKQYPTINIRLLLNSTNLGYDGNLRNLILNATGEFCMFFGDDDILEDNVLKDFVNLLVQRSNTGFVLRSWVEVDLNGQITSIQRYYPSDRNFGAGISTVVEFFRKSVFISGLTVNRKYALEIETSELDGTLLYQLYLLCGILNSKEGYYFSRILAQRVSGAPHFFGTAEAERGKFSPGKLEYKDSLQFMKSFITIVSFVEKKFNISLKRQVTRDLSRYSYGFLSLQRDNGLFVFAKYSFGLYKIGYGCTVYFYIYILLLSIFGKTNMDGIISQIKSRLKSTPKLG